MASNSGIKITAAEFVHDWVNGDPTAVIAAFRKDYEDPKEFLSAAAAIRSTSCLFNTPRDNAYIAAMVGVAKELPPLEAVNELGELNGGVETRRDPLEKATWVAVQEILKDVEGEDRFAALLIAEEKGFREGVMKREAGNMFFAEARALPEDDRRVLFEQAVGFCEGAFAKKLRGALKAMDKKASPRADVKEATRPGSGKRISGQKLLDNTWS